MSECSLRSSDGSFGRRLRWFLAAEAICLVGAGAAVWLGATRYAFVFLLAPLQLALLAVCFKSDYRLLAYFVAVLPLTAIELVPYSYMSFVMYGSVLGLIVFLRVTSFLGPHPEPTTSEPAAWFRTPIILLGICIGVSFLVALVRGWMSSFVFSYSVLAIQVLVLAWVVATVPRSTGQLRQMIYTASVAYAVVCVAFPLVAAQVALGSVGKSFAIGRAFVNLNAVGAHAAAFALVATGAALDARRTGSRMLLLLLAFLLVVVLVYTKSRGAWLGFGLAFIYMIARTRSIWLLLPAAIGLGVLLSLDVLHVALMSRVEATSPDDPSLLGRFELWRYALMVFRDNWLVGVGFENFRFVKQLYGFPTSFTYGLRFNSHNLFLELLADIGVAGSACFWWLLGGTLARVDRIARRSLSSERRWLAVGLSASLIVYVGHGLFDCIIWQHGAFMVLGLLIGMCLCLERLECSQPAIPNQRLRPAEAASAETLS